jgi:TolA-binding protein
MRALRGWVLLLFVSVSFLSLFATLSTYIFGLDTPRRPSASLESRVAELSDNLTTASKSIDEIEQEIESRQDLVARLAADQRQYEQLANLRQSEVDAVAQALRTEIKEEGRRSFWPNLGINIALSTVSAIGGALFGIWLERRILVPKRTSTPESVG